MRVYNYVCIRTCDISGRLTLTLPIIVRIVLPRKGVRIWKRIPVRQKKIPRRLGVDLKVPINIRITTQIRIEPPLILPHPNDWVGRYNLPYMIKTYQESERSMSTGLWVAGVSIILLGSIAIYKYYK